jgi:hypothetical protein
MSVHECAHVHDLDKRVTSFPDETLEQPISSALSICLQVGWNEYAACRLAAYSFPGQVIEMREGLGQAIEGMKPAAARTAAAFASNDGGRQKGINSARDAVLPFLQKFSYLLGHCRGIGISLSQNNPQNYSLLETNTGIAEALSRLERALYALWNSYGAWAGFYVFDELIDVICELVRAVTGLWMKRAEGKD